MKTPNQPADSSTHAKPSNFWVLTLGSIGVVYGDIGTSPLYALREAVSAATSASGEVTRDAVLGVLSLIFWSLIVVVTLKYILILLRADNNGEGGTLSLTALVFKALGRRSLILVLGIVGASMFYGSVLITPALSVLSAVEGLTVATPAFEPYVMPLAVVILVALFSVQWRGTAKVSAFFGPITTVWFFILATAGISQILTNPGVLVALSPYYGFAFLLDNHLIGLVTLGAVFLVVTGSEALYNDLGHFGRKPMQTAWIFLVLPALVLNYFGQGALVLNDPSALRNPFFLMFPEWALYPMVGMATAATVIASQAVITGAYSITRQAMQLGLLPRIEVRHTSAELLGQIYVPRVNWMLLVGVLLLVVIFRSSSALAHAYVLAVATANLMAVTLGSIVIWKVWGWRFRNAALLMLPFVFVDAAFVAATALNIFEGAWLPVVVGGCIMAVMLTWLRGTRLLREKTRRTEVPIEPLVKSLERRLPPVVSGTAIFLTADPEHAPTSLMHNLKHNKVLHEQNVILTVITSNSPRVSEDDRVTIEGISPHFYRLVVTFGYMETPNIPKALAAARKLGWTFDIMSTSFFLSRRALRPAPHSGMPKWQDRLFIRLAHSADDATTYFHIPTDRVVEVGMQVTI